MLATKLFFVVLMLLALALLALSVGIWLGKKRRFPETHIGHNPEMRKRGIVCVKKWDAMEQQKAYGSIDKTSLRPDLSAINKSSISKP